MTDKQFYKRLWWIVLAVASIIFLSIILTMATTCTACEDLFIAGYNKELEKIDSLMSSADSMIYEISMLIDSIDWDLFYQKGQRINNGS